MTNLLTKLLFLLSLISLSIGGYLDDYSTTVTISTVGISTSKANTSSVSAPTEVGSSEWLIISAILLVVILVIVALIIVFFCVIRATIRKEKTENVEASVTGKTGSDGAALKIPTDPKLSGSSDKAIETAASKLTSGQLTPPVDKPQSSKLQKTDSGTAVERKGSGPVTASKSFEAAAGIVTTPPLLEKKGIIFDKQIGEGGFSLVFMAHVTKPYRDSQTNEMIKELTIGLKIACKRFDLTTEDQKLWRDKQLKTELKLMKTLNKLQNKHVVKTYDCLKTRSSAYILMQLADNGSISGYMEKQKKPIEEKICRDWFAQIADAIYFLHQYGIAHRDLKPENFLLNNNFKDVLVTDFGFSVIAMTNDRIMQGTKCGSDLYKAPEVLTLVLGNVYDAKKSDMFSLGASLFEMLNYNTLTSEEALVRLKTYIKFLEAKRYPWNLSAKISQPAKDCVQRLLEVKPELRITADQLLKHEWLKQ